MNIQIYAAKKNPDVLKAERFFKERRIPYQTMDLKKHKLGKKDEEPQEEEEPAPTSEELLTEIRDLLKEQQK